MEAKEDQKRQGRWTPANVEGNPVVSGSVAVLVNLTERGQPWALGSVLAGFDASLT